VDHAVQCGPARGQGRSATAPRAPADEPRHGPVEEPTRRVLQAAPEPGGAQAGAVHELDAARSRTSCWRVERRRPRAAQGGLEGARPLGSVQTRLSEYGTTRKFQPSRLSSDLHYEAPPGSKPRCIFRDWLQIAGGSQWRRRADPRSSSTRIRLCSRNSPWAGREASGPAVPLQGCRVVSSLAPKRHFNPWIPTRRVRATDRPAGGWPRQRRRSSPWSRAGSISTACCAKQPEARQEARPAARPTSRRRRA